MRPIYGHRFLHAMFSLLPQMNLEFKEGWTIQQSATTITFMTMDDKPDIIYDFSSNDDPTWVVCGATPLFLYAHSTNEGAVKDFIDQLTDQNVFQYIIDHEFFFQQLRALSHRGPSPEIPPILDDIFQEIKRNYDKLCHDAIRAAREERTHVVIADVEGKKIEETLKINGIFQRAVATLFYNQCFKVLLSKDGNHLLLSWK